MLVSYNSWCLNGSIKKKKGVHNLFLVKKSNNFLTTKMKIKHKSNLSEFLNSKYWLFKILNHAKSGKRSCNIFEKKTFYSHEKL